MLSCVSLLNGERGWRRAEPCSFCNRNELESSLKSWDVDELDISLLETTINQLRSRSQIPSIQSHRLFNNQYRACSACSRCVKKKKFSSVPIMSWANGCWIGEVPPELSCLSYAEELVIARAHSTKCWFKLSAGPRAQRAAHGKVCIHPHDISTHGNVLPRPLSTLYDEIVVIFVSNGGDLCLKSWR